MKFQNCIFLFPVFMAAASINITQASANIQYPSDTLRIAFSKARGSEKYERYIKWIKQFNSNIVCIDLINETPENGVKILESCDGLILTGGLDVDPARYGKPNDTSRCELDRSRDTLEFALIEKAMALRLPVLAICRGAQILNVAMGGSLIIDISADHDTLVEHRSVNSIRSRHFVKIYPNTFLSKLCKTKGDTANSSHHQAVDMIAPCFKVSAYATDSIVEAYEWKEPIDKQFLIAVQWHPEGLDFKSRLAYPLGKYFLKESRKYMRNLKHPKN